MPEPVVIVRALDAERIASPLIERHHRHLLGARVLFLFTNKQRTKGEKVVLGTAQKMAPLQKYLSSALDPDTGMPSVDEGYDFLILLDSNEWATLNAKQRTALVDHELMHCWVDAEGAFKLRAHDVEEFADIIARHGLWKSDVQTFGEVIRQMRLAEAVPAA